MMPTIRAGSAVVIVYEVLDMLANPPALSNPNGGVKLTLTDPLDAAAVDAQAMTLTTVGRFVYTYQTDSATSPLGVWTVDFKVQHDSDIVLTEPAGGFVLAA